MATYKKTIENELEVTETIPQEIIPVKVEVTKFNRKFLDEQKINIQSDYDRDAATLALRQAELDDINTKIAECDKLGIVAEVIE